MTASNTFKRIAKNAYHRGYIDAERKATARIVACYQARMLPRMIVVVAVALGLGLAAGAALHETYTWAGC